MNVALLVGLVLLGVFAVLLWVDYCNARALGAPIALVSWRYHVRVRWWLTRDMKIDLFWLALAAGWCAWDVLA